jgi:hypothetical protein
MTVSWPSSSFRSSHLSRARGVAWWAVTAFLTLEILVSLGDFVGYHEDPETYARVYRDPFLQQAVSRVFGVLALIALYAQIRVWRGRRFSIVAIGYLVAVLCFAIADWTFGIVRVCCT